MPESGQVPLTGEAVVFAPARASRPASGKDGCPFCPGNESATLPELDAVRDGTEPDSPGWRVRAVPNLYPLVTLPAGKHEVIVDDREHAVVLSSESLLIYRNRFAFYESQPWANAVVLFKNVGRDGGATIEHPHAQLVALAEAPGRMRRMWTNAWGWHSERGECHWCALLSRDAVYRNDSFALTRPAVARFDGELLLLPAQHEASFASLSAKSADAFVDAFAAAQQHLGENYNVLFFVPLRAEGQPHLHWHVSLVPRERRFGGFELATGMWIVEDEDSGPRSVM